MTKLLKHRTLTGVLLEEIRQAILSGRYPAGSQLRQDALAEEYGVSRIPVREVLLQLEAEGLVVIQARRGAVVSIQSREEIEDIFGLRTLLESRLYRASAPLLTSDDLDQVEAIHDRYAEAIAAHEIARFGELNAELHMAFYAKAPMPRSLHIVSGLLTTTERYTRVQLSSPEAMQRAIAEHAELIALTRNGAFAFAALKLVEHIEAVHSDLNKVLQKTAALPDTVT